MIICICNNITPQDLIDDPSLEEIVGSNCGMCVEFLLPHKLIDKDELSKGVKDLPYEI